MMDMKLKFEDTIDSADLQQAFLNLPFSSSVVCYVSSCSHQRRCYKEKGYDLLCIADRDLSDENMANRTLDKLTERGFIKPVPKIQLGAGQLQDVPFRRWHSSASHHIEVTNANILHGLKNLEHSRFLSLQGIALIRGFPSFISKHAYLEILDLRACHNLEVVPHGIGLLVQLTHWDIPTSCLRLANMKALKTLYMRGGKLCDLGEFQVFNDEDGWTVEILHLKYLNELEIDWRGPRLLFPKLIFLRKVDCNKLTNFPCDENGVWIDKVAIDQAQLAEI
ncbi:hypothetical protein Acr_10g0006690 [Actinidia rufa]|uniref:Uncharacterized protein n=1 Tax=Actinidia rufa TaxID=165716 RepID=A0A7J0F9A1_9ERIC|nr:hypothetical protein Acr_10g0006690 [Actinidia rufa]